MRRLCTWILVSALCLAACANPQSKENSAPGAAASSEESTNELSWLYFHDCGETPFDAESSPALDCATARFTSGSDFRLVFTERICGLTDIGMECNDVRSVLLGNERGDLFVLPLAYVVSEPSMRVYRRSYTLMPVGFPVVPPEPTSPVPVSVPLRSTASSTPGFRAELSVTNEGNVTLCNVRNVGISEDVRHDVCSALISTTFKPATALTVPIASSVWVACESDDNAVTCHPIEPI